jgi:predicted HNH restriction endonuclease
MSYQQALTAIYPELSEPQQSVLSALLYASQCSSSSGQLSRLLGMAVIQVNSALGRVGRRLFEVTKTHPDNLPEGSFEWWHMLATGEPTKDLGFVWKLRPEAISALQAAGCSQSGMASAQEVYDTQLIEGAVRRVTVNAYERNPVARKRCIAAHGANCVICGFNFEATYGAAAAGYIHVHHVTPLAEINRSYEVNPVTDLVPLCPNCHAVVHLTNPPQTIEQVKNMLVRA